MSRIPRVPDALRAGPFRSAEALRYGVSSRQLQSDSWRRVLHDVHVWAELPDDMPTRLAAAALVLPAGAAFSHRTATWLHRLDSLGGVQVPTVTVPTGVAFAARQGLTVRHAPLPASDVVSRRRWPATTASRSAFDLARTEPAAEAVACVDAVLHAAS